jgi:hypothetical protein
VTAAPAVAIENNSADKAPAALEPPAASEAPVAQDETQEKSEAQAPAAASMPNRGVTRATAVPPKPEAVIPLVHAPDDPGPDSVDETTPRPEAPNGGWRRIFE